MNTKQRVTLAWRNVIRHRRRSGSAILAVSAGVIAMLLAGGFIEWSLWYGRDAVIRSQFGHFQIVRPGYYEKGLADPYRYQLPEVKALVEEIAKIDGVEAVSPRLSFTGLASIGDATLSFVGEGVSPESETQLGGALRLIEGENLSSNDVRGAILGRGLAGNLGANVGDTMVLLSTLENGGINAVEVHVRGIFGTVMRAYDDAVLKIPLSLAQELTRAQGAHVIAVLLRDEEAMAAAINETRDRLKGAHYDIIPWRQLSDYYTKTEQLFTQQFLIVKIIISMVILLSIMNSMYMAVAERTTEIGTMLALGNRRRDVLKQFLYEGLILGLLGAIGGVITAAGLGATISYVGIPMPPPPGGGDSYVAEIQLTWPMILSTLGIALAASIAATALPAYKASQLQIVDALRRGV